MPLIVEHIVSGSVHINLPADVQDKFVGLLTQLFDQGHNIMATLDDLKAAMAAEDTKVQGLIAAYQDMATKLAAAVGANDPVALQALVDEANATSAAIDAAQNPAPASPPAP